MVTVDLTDARPDPADPAGAALLGVLLRFAFEYRLARLAACGAVARAARVVVGTVARGGHLMRHASSPVW